MVVLARTLPSTAHVSNWSMAWVGLDAMMAAGLLGTGVLLARRDPRHGLTAAATGALLAMDAWFDVLTSAPGAERTLALALAAGMELPLAGACGILAVRALRPQRGAVQPPDDSAGKEGRRPESHGRPSAPTWTGRNVKGAEDVPMKGRWQSIDASTPDG
ncbi:hypothetical protein [Actinomadura opuntiae]|uniref:hypothetical protein n=1 Tax=Actinomadura sp. OS1-43 TaxID=604315 RepID=UPI00255B2413|nr:hypothetical protein [Actinomadura sp. OS1-43]MDL4815888.1 hypothetical protein [Actinomadura sp. OS1-43]